MPVPFALRLRRNSRTLARWLFAGAVSVAPWAAAQAELPPQWHVFSKRPSMTPVGDAPWGYYGTGWRPWNGGDFDAGGAVSPRGQFGPGFAPSQMPYPTMPSEFRTTQMPQGQIPNPASTSQAAASPSMAGRFSSEMPPRSQGPDPLSRGPQFAHGPQPGTPTYPIPRATAERSQAMAGPQLESTAPREPLPSRSMGMHDAAARESANQRRLSGGELAARTGDDRGRVSRPEMAARDSGRFGSRFPQQPSPAPTSDAAHNDDPQRLPRGLAAASAPAPSRVPAEVSTPQGLLGAPPHAAPQRRVDYPLPTIAAAPLTVPSVPAPRDMEPTPPRPRATAARPLPRHTPSEPLPRALPRLPAPPTEPDHAFSQSHLAAEPAHRVSHSEGPAEHSRSQLAEPPRDPAMRPSGDTDEAWPPREGDTHDASFHREVPVTKPTPRARSVPRAVPRAVPAPFTRQPLPRQTPPQTDSDVWPPNDEE